MTKRIVSIKFYTVRMPDGKYYRARGRSILDVVSHVGVNVADVVLGAVGTIPDLSEYAPDPLTALRAYLAACTPLLAALKPGDDAELLERQGWAALRDAVERAGTCAGNISTKEAV